MIIEPFLIDILKRDLSMGDKPQLTSSEKTIFDHLQQAILVVNPAYQVILCNDAASQLWERPSHKLIGQAIDHLFSGNEILKRHAEHVFASGRDIHLVDFPCHLHPYQSRIVEIIMNPIFGDVHEIQQILITIADHTHHAEHKAKEQEQAVLDSIGLFMSSIAHEIHNPLSGIKGATQLLQRDLEKSNQSTDATEMILHEL